MLAVISGVTSGIGLEMTKSLIVNNWAVIGLVRNLDKRKNELDPFLLQAKNLNLVDCDLKNNDELRALAHHDWILQSGLDLLVNNAGYGLWGPFELAESEAIDHQMQVNFLGPITLTKTLLPHIRRNKGQVYNISSVMAVQPMPLSSMYCASKAALDGWSESLFWEMKPHQVSVVSFNLGAHKTKFGANGIWSLSADNDKVYRPQVLGFKAFQDKLKSRKSADPAMAARKILSFISSRPQTPAVTIGNDAKWLAGMKKFLPFYNKLIGRFFSNIFGPGKVEKEIDEVECLKKQTV